MKRITQVRKRDGRVVPFDPRRVADAIYHAARSVGGEDRFLAEELAGVVGLYLERSHGGAIPDVADVEDTVERVLVDTGHAKTAKAFILHRDRRRSARERFASAAAAPPGDVRPVVGTRDGEIRAWSKPRIVDAILREGAADRPTAEDVARAVEARVFSSRAPRVSTALLRALVDAELFDRGIVAAAPRDGAGVPTRELRARIEAGPSDRRATDPAAVAEGLGEELLGRWLLSDGIPAPAAEAHRAGDLFLADLRAPFAAGRLALDLASLLDRTLRGDGVARGAGARRFASAIGEIVARHAGSAGRTFTLEDWNVHLAPHVDRFDEDALAAEVREQLLSPGFLGFPRRGGRLRLELVLAATVPVRLADHPVPPPAPPGRSLRDTDDAAYAVARATLAACAALAREGLSDRLPDLTVVLPRPALREPAMRALLRDALDAALQGGEPVVRLEDPANPTRGGRHLRVPADDGTDPLRRGGGDVAVATEAAVNLAGAAWRAGEGGVDACLDEVERLVGLAMDAALARRGILERGGESPDGSLWSLRQGLVPLLDLDRAVHVIEPVGAAVAAERLAGSDEAARTGLEERLLARFEAAVAARARALDLRAEIRRGGEVDAAARFLDADAARYPDCAVRALADPEALALAYGADRRRASGSSPLPDRVPLGPAWGRGRAPTRLRLAIDADERPSLERLVGLVEREVAADPSIVEIVVDPWPRRVRRDAAE